MCLVERIRLENLNSKGFHIKSNIPGVVGSGFGISVFAGGASETDGGGKAGLTGGKCSVINDCSLTSFRILAIAYGLTIC